MKIEFMSDNIKLGTKKVDGTIPVILDVGEYERKKLKDILSIPDQTNLKVNIETQNDK